MEEEIPKVPSSILDLPWYIFGTYLGTDQKDSLFDANFPFTRRYQGNQISITYSINVT